VIGLCGNTRTYRRPRCAILLCGDTAGLQRRCADPAALHRLQAEVAVDNPIAAEASPLIRPLWLFRCLTRFGISAIVLVLVIHALVNPYLYADMSLSDQCFGEAVIDFRPQRAQRDGAGDLFFAARHFRPAQAAGKLNLNPFAPASIVCSIARFITRRNPDRFSNCSTMSSATSWRRSRVD